MTFKETKIGIIPEHWEVLPIKEITEVVTDYNLQQDRPPYLGRHD